MIASHGPPRIQRRYLGLAACVLQRDVHEEVVRDLRVARQLVFHEHDGLLARADDVTLTEALGNTTPGVPATTAMHYRIGGIAETFLSTVLLILSVTVRMLAANTAGYPDYVHMQPWVDRLLSDPFKAFTDDELIAYAVADNKMAYAPPGSSQAYSHTEYVVLGQIMQRATGKSMKELYETHVLGPAGRTRSFLPTPGFFRIPR